MSMDMNVQEQIEDTSGLSQGIDISIEMLTSIAISLKRIADAMVVPEPAGYDRFDDDGQFGVGV